MKAAFAHLSPIVPATFAAAIAISLTIFQLPGAGLQSGPTPLLSSFGGAAGRMAADLPPTANRRVLKPTGTGSSAAQLVVSRTLLVPKRQQRAASQVHRVHRRSRARIVRHAPPAAQVRGPAAPEAPATTSLFSTSGKTKSNGRGHRARATRVHGHGKTHEHSNEHHHRLPPGHSKKTPTGSPPATAPSKANRGGKGNGPRGGKK